MTCTATPTLSVAGLGIALSGDDGLVAVDQLALSWGRASVLEAPTPATLQLTVRDHSRRGEFAGRTDLIGQVVVVGWATTDGWAGVNFRGRITDVATRPRRGAVAGRGWTTTIAASSLEVGLANWKVPKGTTYPAETFAARRSRIDKLLPLGRFDGGIVLPTRLDLGLPAAALPSTDLDTLTAAQVDASGKTALDLLRELFASLSPLPMVYDPEFDQLTYAPRRRYAYSSAGMTQSVRMLPAAEAGGRYVPTALSQLRLDAAHLEHTGPAAQGIAARLTRVEVGYLDETAAYAARTAAKTLPGAALIEGDIGRRTMTVDTIHATAAGAVQLAGLYGEFAENEARTPRLDVIGYSTRREPLPDGLHARLLLSGHERPGELFLRGSWLPQLRLRPVVGILGGTVTYAAGHWSIEMNPAPVVVDPAPFTWGPITAASQAGSGVRLSDIDSSVKLGDLGFVDVGPGWDLNTALPYKGNGL